MLFIGPMDISQSLGYPGDPAHPEVQQVVRQVIDTCSANEKTFGIFVGTTEAARKYRDLGASYIAIASDLAFMAKGYHQMVDELKKYSLDVPQVTLLAHELKEKGVPLSDGILTIDELVDELCQS